MPSGENKGEAMAAAAAAKAKEEEEKKEPSNEEDEDDDDDDEEDTGAGTENGEANKKKKKTKKKKKKKKKAAEGNAGNLSKPGEIREPANKPLARGLKETAFSDYYVKFGQTDPPKIPIADLFRGRELPVNEIQPHHSTTKTTQQHQTYRETAKEADALDNWALQDVVQKLRLGAEVHRQV